MHYEIDGPTTTALRAGVEKLCSCAQEFEVLATSRNVPATGVLACERAKRGIGFSVIAQGRMQDFHDMH